MENDQDPKSPDMPELQETLENEEINTAKTAEDNVTPEDTSVENAPIKSEATAPEAAAKPEESEEAFVEADKAIAEDSAAKKDKRMLIAIIILSVIAVLGLGIGVFAILNTGKTKEPDTSVVKEDSKKKEEQKEQAEKELKEKEAKDKEEKEKKEKEAKDKEEKEKKEQEEKEKKEKEEKEAKEALKTTLDAEGVVTHIQELLATEQLAEKSQLVIENRDNALYQPAGYKTHIYLSGKNLSGEGIAKENSYMDEIMPVVETALGELAFEKLETLNDPFIWISRATIYYNPNTNVTCTSYHFLPQILACAKATNYDLGEKNLTNNLAEAYNKTEGKYPLVVSSNTEKDGKKSLNAAIKDTGYKQYQTMTINLGMNAASIFYRESPSSEWKYLTSTQAALDCSAYSTDLKKALGDQCEK
ncbi:hypothetical protein J6T21_00215 [Candidatus Saccharibacteria bacterium]|nr:hypothetical protein [Candidatus Saccharibacteria bacterium]